MMFTRGVSGTRVITGRDDKDVKGHHFDGAGIALKGHVVRAISDGGRNVYAIFFRIERAMGLLFINI